MKREPGYSAENNRGWRITRTLTAIGGRFFRETSGGATVGAVELKQRRAFMGALFHGTSWLAARYALKPAFKLPLLALTLP